MQQPPLVCTHVYICSKEKWRERTPLVSKWADIILIRKSRRSILGTRSFVQAAAGKGILQANHSLHRRNVYECVCACACAGVCVMGSWKHPRSQSLLSTSGICLAVSGNVDWFDCSDDARREFETQPGKSHTHTFYLVKDSIM